MSIKTAIFIIIGSAIFAFGAIYAGFSFSYNTDERSLRETINTQIDVANNDICDIWDIISSELCIDDIYEEEFRKICPELLFGSTDEEHNIVINWLSIRSSRFKEENYDKILTTIDVYRLDFIKTQTNILDNIQKHQELCTSYPSSFFVCDKSEIPYVPILLEDK